MDPREREALSSLRLSWAPTADDLWHSQGALHVPGFNDKALDDVMSAFTDAGREQQSSPLGVVVQGPAGSGKTHLLGQVRERVQAIAPACRVERLGPSHAFVLGNPSREALMRREGYGPEAILDACRRLAAYSTTK